MKKPSIILFIILAYIHANTIQEIIITGNSVTKDSTILDLISHSPGDSINTEQAIEDQAALFNSELFYDAIIYPDNSKYYIFVWEKPAIFPRPEIDKHDILGWSYGGSVLFNNLKGENKKLKLSALIGASTLIDIQYSNPKIYKTNDSLNINLYNKFYDNTENDYTIYSRGIKTSFALLTQNTSHQIKISNKVEYYKLLSGNGNNENNYSITNSLGYQVKLGGLNNRLKIKLAHLYFEHTYKNYFSMNLENDYYIYFNDINPEDQNRPRLLIRNQLKINTSNNIPIYDKDYIISEDYVRGYNINQIPDDFNTYENNLLWNNIMASTIQIELPFYDNGVFSRNLLFFWDWGVGWDRINFNHFELIEKSKIRSFGIGIRYDIIKIAKIDICIGMTPYNGNKELQVIVRNF